MAVSLREFERPDLLQLPEAIKTYFSSLGFFNPENIAVWVEDGRLCPSGKIIGDGFRLLHIEYTLTIRIERWPLALPENELFAHVLAFLFLHGSPLQREGQTARIPEFELIRNDDDAIAEVEIVLYLTEPIDLVPDAEGRIVLNGQSYSVGPVPVRVAETAEVEDLHHEAGRAAFAASSDSGP
uniref:P2 phage tail completion protein R (GpR) n=1 Tax=Candidatus Kentrum sp. FM TaxID=2126340 RepID=A0A450RV18_9GAMM|nr:MAG: P2 phage tail completion protein R (GpR) [Candidatus Kentron sp. FM]VFJ43642.1 MAG: P2 phage tail completion protein R (GpR) [Candidatus Kentron sp. FM]VFK05649.1 MAG: P2 phage tail completion protein R (GpR) [Candidatus Kentron sp. FM]